MALKTRQNPETGILEVLVNDQWVCFEDYRKRQIDEAYQNSIKYLRERLGEDAAQEVMQKSDEKADCQQLFNTKGQRVKGLKDDKE